ncbi:MAG: fhlA 3 [Verrucomicrobiales bacterium]|nr:fhlA 3 [Verrucomicrobiales bacterium]
MIKIYMHWLFLGRNFERAKNSPFKIGDSVTRSYKFIMEILIEEGPTNFESSLLLDLANQRTVQELLKTLIHRVMERRPGVARFRIWMVEKETFNDDLSRGGSPQNGAGSLQVVASGRRADAEAPIEYSTVIEDACARVSLGDGWLGKIALAGRQSVLKDLDQDPGELAHIDWLKSEGLRGFNGGPMIYTGEVLGVGALFSRTNFPESARIWSRVFADHVAGFIANVRAFEEIQRLKTQLEQQNAYLKEEVIEAKAFGDLVGQSAALRQVVSQIDLVAPTEASVLIQGETGTGKELVAHEIHRRSRRAQNPLIRVNCASIPKDLFESEFFGHARGAFTGAVKDRAGRFETAEGGTLFLDEIGEVPLDLQGKLLRVLQEKRYERVGEDRTRHADVRIIGATNRDLKKEMSAGRFREDLYYRLNVFPIQVAGLRDRRGDIPLLARHFIDLSVKELRCKEPRLTRAGIIKLENYDWPGNIRELRNVIERAVIIARGGPLDFDLPGGASSPAPAASSESATPALGFFTETEMQQRERENLINVLQKTGWKIKGADGAAELLGVKPTTLLSRINKMGLTRPG